MAIANDPRLAANGSQKLYAHAAYTGYVCSDRNLTRANALASALLILKGVLYERHYS